ncbi:MAG: hypothetical protein ACRDV0_09030 [Acidimicrobiales bacterium]
MSETHLTALPPDAQLSINFMVGRPRGASGPVKRGSGGCAAPAPGGVTSRTSIAPTDVGRAALRSYRDALALLLAGVVDDSAEH